jgi:hypothetical protein
MTAERGAASEARPGHWRRYRTLYAVIALCAAPVIASYLAYYVFPPSGRTNYGTLLDPRPLPDSSLAAADGRTFSFTQLRGKWVMVMVADAACNADCQSALLQMRQQRLMTGKERDRVERVWLVSDEATPHASLLEGFEGTFVARAPLPVLREFVGEVPNRSDGALWLVDPMGNVMLRWPPHPQPSRVKKDLARLLTASSHWTRVERTP